MFIQEPQKIIAGTFNEPHLRCILLKQVRTKVYNNHPRHLPKTLVYILILKVKCNNPKGNPH